MLISIAHAASEATCIAQGFLNKLNDAVIFPLIILLLAAAFLLFLYGGLKFILNPQDLKEQSEGRSHMLYGIIGLVVMTSAAAILAIAAGTFGISTDPPRCGNNNPSHFDYGGESVGGDGPIDSNPYFEYGGESSGGSGEMDGLDHLDFGGESSGG
jgi:hypothetical protein